MIERFLALVEQEDEKELPSFLRDLPADQKRKLSPAIKKLAKEYSQFGPIGNNTYGLINGTDKKRSMLQLASFVCFNLSDYERSPYAVWMLDKERLNPIIDWYCPDWFSDFVNKQASQEFIPPYLHYYWIMELTERGFMQPSKELLVQVMPQMIFEQNDGNTWSFKPENILALPITRKEHIWYLFELESNIHYSERFLRFANTASKEKIGWIQLFKKYTDENLIDRSRVLSESLLASNRNFNKVLSGWFSQMFAELNPSIKEVITLQSELFSVLSSPHSKPVNTSLQAIRKIVTEPDFNANAFLDAMPVLLASDTKAVILSSLTILDKLAQVQPVTRERIVLLVCQCFIQADEELQTKAAKIIAKFGDSGSDFLKGEIKTYQASMLTSARLLLNSFHEYDASAKTSEAEAVFAIDKTPALADSNLISLPATIDDLIFLASQAFDNNEPWHIDLLAASLLQYRRDLKGENLPLLEPAFQRAFGLLKNNFRSTTGSLDHLLAIFFIDYGNWLIRHFPSGGESIERIYKTYDIQDGEQRTSYLVVPTVGSYTAKWEPFGKTAFYEPYKLLLLTALEKIRTGDDLPLLSTPTHSPCWISPGVLVDRLSLYQQAGRVPSDIDLEIAISRVFVHNAEEALNQAKLKLDGEFRALLLFLLNESNEPQKPFSYKGAWVVASLTRNDKKTWAAFESFSYYKNPFNNYNGELHWESKAETYTSSRYDFSLRKTVNEPATRKILSVHREYGQSEASGLKKIFSKLLPAAKDDPPMLYEFLNYRVSYLSVEHNDIKRILSLAPNNPEPLLADTINKCLQHPEFWGESDKKMVFAISQFLYDTWKAKPGTMTYLFLGTIFLSADKTIINIAGEIWLQAVATSSIDNVTLGKIIGQHESIEFAPLKRFTDIVSQNLFRVSDVHNQQLQVLIENIIPFLPEEPIKNIKKLLEIYKELLVANKSEIEQASVILKLEKWKSKASLAKVIQSLTEGH